MKWGDKELVEALNNGKKVRRKAWNDSIYLFKHGDFIEGCLVGIVSMVVIVGEDARADDWEIIA